MDKDSLITEELKGKIGIESEPQVYEIEKGVIRRFARAIDDQNPLWQDEEFAQRSKYGGIIAPPTFIPIVGNEQIQQQSALLSTMSILHGGTELECYQSVRPGDTITVTTKLANIRERQGKMGKTVFMTFDIIYKNQRQEAVAKCRQIVISY